MGLRSGLYAGQSSSSTLNSPNHVFMDLALCTGPQSDALIFLYISRLLECIVFLKIRTVVKYKKVCNGILPWTLSLRRTNLKILLLCYSLLHLYALFLHICIQINVHAYLHILRMSSVLDATISITSTVFSSLMLLSNVSHL